MPEEDPSGQGNTVMVCIVLTGELDDDVEVVLTTMSGSATGDIQFCYGISSLVGDELLYRVCLHCYY